MTDTAPIVKEVTKTAAEIVLAKVTAKLGETQAQALTPVIIKYGPALASMSAAEMWSWLEQAIKGDAYASYAAILAKMPAGELLGEWDKVNAKWKDANTANAASLAWQREATSAVLKALVTIMAALVVL